MIIRKIKDNEIDLLKDFLFEAIFIPDGVEIPQKNIINNPELKLYYDNFGQSKDDNCLVAEIDGKIVGAVWTRIMNDYGHIDDLTPSLAISLYKGYRRQGIGTRLMLEMIKLLKDIGYKNISLSVQKLNYAYKMYLNVGFSIVNETKDEYIMICKL